MCPTPRSFMVAPNCIEGVSLLRHLNLMDILADDLLWEIFLLNADMDTDSKVKIQSTTAKMYERAEVRSRALPTTTYTSQVCRRWRDVILGSPSLWGRIIDLELLFLAKENWRVEVLGRTGDSLLYVKGPYEGFLKQRLRHHVGAAIAIIDREWFRIQKVYLTMSLSEDTWPLGIRGFWEIFQRPAEHLESFYLSTSIHDCAPPSDTLPTGLFENHAPLLQHFSCAGLRFAAPQMVIFNHSIRSIVIENYIHSDRPTFFFSTSDLLDGLAETPRLEKLILKNALKNPAEPMSKPKWAVSLPFLKNVSISSHQCLWTKLLGHITPGDKLRRFDVCVYSQGAPSPEDDATVQLAIKDIFSTYARACFSVYHPAAVLLEIDNYSLRIFERNSGDLRQRHPTSDLLIHIHDTSRKNIHEYFNAFASRLASSVTHLQVRRITDLRVPIEEIAQFFPAMLSFSSVKVIRLDLGTMVTFTSLPPPKNSILAFPFLKRVEIITTLRMLDLEETQEAMINFLCPRQVAGIPIEILDLTFNRRDQDQEGSFGWLDEFTGLKVLWKAHDETIREYLCGQTLSHVEI